MLESTGSHGRSVERRVPEMRCMVEYNCTSTLCEQSVSRLGRSTLLLNSKAPEQMTAVFQCHVIILSRNDLTQFNHISSSPSRAH